jgi:hypothetical protein
MLFALGLFLLALHAPSESRDRDFSKSYGVSIGSNKGTCTYFLTDVGLNASQLKEALSSNGYDFDRVIEVLTQSGTPKRCVDAARRSVLAAGFRRVRVRLSTQKDLGLGRLP